MASRTENAKRNIRWALLQRMMFILCPFFIRALFIEKFNSEYLGLSSLCTSILTILNMSEMGFSSAVLFCLYKPVAENDIKAISSLMFFFKKVYRIIGFFVFATGSLISYFLPLLIKGEMPQNINIYIIFFLFLLNTCLSYLLWGYRSTLLLAHQRNDIESKIISVTYFLQYAIQVISIIVLENFYLYITSLLLSTIVANILRKIISDKLYPNIECADLISKEQKLFIGKKVAGAFIQKLCATTRTSLGPIFVSLFLGLTQTAIYDNYMFIITSIKGTLDLLVNAITTSIGDSIAMESTTKNFRDLRRFTLLYSIIGGFCTISIFCIVQPFMELWMGVGYMVKLDTVFILSLYFYILTIGDIRSAYIVGAGLWWEGRYRSITETLVNILLIYLLGYFFGMNGIILATLFSVLLINFIWGNTILFDNYFKNESQFLFIKDTIYYFSITVLIGGLCYLIISLVSISNNILDLLFRIAVVIIISFTCYMIIYRRNQFFYEIIGTLFGVKKSMTRKD